MSGVWRGSQDRDQGIREVWDLVWVGEPDVMDPRIGCEINIDIKLVNLKVGIMMTPLKYVHVVSPLLPPIQRIQRVVCLESCIRHKSALFVTPVCLVLFRDKSILSWT